MCGQDAAIMNYEQLSVSSDSATKVPDVEITAMRTVSG